MMSILKLNIIFLLFTLFNVTAIARLRCDALFYENKSEFSFKKNQFQTLNNIFLQPLSPSLYKLSKALLTIEKNKSKEKVIFSSNFNNDLYYNESKNDYDLNVNKLVQILNKPQFTDINYGYTKNEIEYIRSLVDSYKRYLKNNPIDNESVMLANLILKLKIEKIKYKHIIEEFKLTDEDFLAIYTYTANTFSDVNPYLRQPIEKSDELNYYKNYLNAAIDKLPSYKGLSLRGLRQYATLEKDYCLDCVVNSSAFTSTSITAPLKTDILLVIDSKNGKDISLLSRFVKEKEVLFKSGTRFLVTKIENKNSLQKTIYLTEISTN